MIDNETLVMIVGMICITIMFCTVVVIKGFKGCEDNGDDGSR